MASISEFGRFFLNIVTSMRFLDFIDIAIVAVVVYYVIRFIRERRAGKLAIGIVALVIIKVLSDLLDLVVLKYILENIFQIALIALIILFQPELRSLLERVGSGTLRGFSRFRDTKDKSYLVKVNNEICEACSDLSESKTGALIVLERSVKLGDIISSGSMIDAETSSILLKNIFFNKSPLHDGAVVIRRGRIHAASCLLPLTGDNNKLDKSLGTRHRAAVGMSENSDAIKVVVSEENGAISIAIDGDLKYNIDYSTLRLILDKEYANFNLTDSDISHSLKKEAGDE